MSTNDWTYLYDNNGNRISKLATDGSGNGLLYFYDDHNRLTEVQDALSLNTLASYAYNALGQRISKVTSSGTTYYAYSPTGQLVAELKANGETLANYLYRDGQPLAVTQYTEVQDPAPTPQTIIIDNDSAQTSSTGSWQSKNSGQATNGSYRLSNNNGNTYRWTPTGLNASTSGSIHFSLGVIHSRITPRGTRRSTLSVNRDCSLSTPSHAATLRYPESPAPHRNRDRRTDRPGSGRLRYRSGSTNAPPWATV